MKLLIVESPAKARKIQQYLGSGWQVKACLGHVRDLPAKGDRLPEKYQGRVLRPARRRRREQLLAHLRHPQRQSADDPRSEKAAKSAEAVYLASDPDREGESIAWHLSVLLGFGKDAQRVTYQEITERAIRQAVASPTTIDFHLVAAQETRRVLDRLAGYGVSPLLWKAVGGPQSAGRVQSAALMLLSQREQSRLGFVPSAFWRVAAMVDSTPPSVRPSRPSGTCRWPPPRASRQQGQLKPDLNVAQLDAQKAKQLVAYLNRQQAVVQRIEVTPVVRRPPPPLTTSGLQQAANAKLKLGAAQVTKLAQRLYEGGLITYIRTDSPHLSDEAIQLAREALATRFGPSALPQTGGSTPPAVPTPRKRTRPSGRRGSSWHPIRAVCPATNGRCTS